MYSRHDLAWLTAPGWDAALADAGNAHIGLLERWRSAAWPLVVTRRAPDAAPDTVCLGLAAPPEDGRKPRVALRAKAPAILRSRQALTLEDAGASAPASWRPALARLREQANGLDLRVFGSLAMQTITGQAYICASSDIDLLFKPASRRQLQDGVALLQAHAGDLPLDGEILFPDESAVAWKEWAGAVAAQARVLVKQNSEVRLVSTAALLASLEA